MYISNAVVALENSDNHYITCYNFMFSIRNILKMYPSLFHVYMTSFFYSCKFCVPMLPLEAKNNDNMLLYNRDIMNTARISYSFGFLKEDKNTSDDDIKTELINKKKDSHFIKKRIYDEFKGMYTDKDVQKKEVYVRSKFCYITEIQKNVSILKLMMSYYMFHDDDDYSCVHKISEWLKKFINLRIVKCSTFILGETLFFVKYYMYYIYGNSFIDFLIKIKNEWCPLVKVNSPTKIKPTNWVPRNTLFVIAEIFLLKNPNDIIDNTTAYQNASMHFNKNSKIPLVYF